jgi:hypothetical protein
MGRPNTSFRKPPGRCLEQASALICPASDTVVRQMQSARLYQRYATRCLQAARTTSDSKHKAFLVDMAQAWQRLADQAKAVVQTPISSSEPDRGD